MNDQMIQKVTILLLIAIQFAACDSRVNLPYEFKDQPVQGKISGNTWLIEEAIARVSLFSADTLSFQLSDSIFGSECDYLISESGARFTAPFKEGIFLLSSKSIQYQSVSIYQGGVSLEALSGAIQIISINNAEGTIEAQLDAVYDQNNQLNGKFTARFCPQ
jgi:hypothetical protein